VRAVRTSSTRASRTPPTSPSCSVGALDPGHLMPLVLRYLGGIPCPAPGAPLPFPMNFQRDELTAVPSDAPKGVAREEVQRRMIEEQSTTQVCHCTV